MKTLWLSDSLTLGLSGLTHWLPLTIFVVVVDSRTIFVVVVVDSRTIFVVVVYCLTLSLSDSDYMFTESPRLMSVDGEEVELVGPIKAHNQTQSSIYHFYLVISVYPSIRLSVYPSIRLSVYPSIRQFVNRSIRLSVYPSICLSVYPSISLDVYMSVSPSVHLSICISVYFSIRLSL